MKKLISTLHLDRNTWLQYRKQGIGGSDAGAVCGLNPYSSPIQIYYDKVSDTISQYDNEAMRQGRDLEEYVAKRFCEETGFRVRRANAIYYDEKRPYMLADADRLIIGAHAGLECKTVSPYSADKWSNGNIPMHYQIQSYHYMSVFGMQEWYIAALIFGKDFIIHKLEWDDTLIENLREIEKDFWQNYVMKKKIPVPDGSEASEMLIHQLYGNSCAGNRIPLLGFSERLHRRDELVQLMQKMDTEKKQIEQELKLYLGEAEVAEGDGYRVTWKSVTSNRMDSERMKQEHPEMYQQYLKPINSRRLTIRSIE